MKKIIDKRNYIILFIIIILIIWILFFNKQTVYIKSFNYFGNTITYEIYDKVNHKKVDNDINNIYKAYTKKVDKKLSDEMYSLIEYGKLLYYETDGYIDITSGKLIKYLKNNKKYNFQTQIDKVNIKNQTLKNDIDFNLDNIITTYATNDVIYYFKQNDIKHYLINENGDITAGKRYKDKYKIGINKINGDLLHVVLLENKAMATRNKSDDFKSYMVNPKTSKIEKKYDSVVVIANNNLTANMLSNTLYLMDKEEGKKFIEKYNAEALWIDDEITYTEGFKKYIKK